MKQVFAWVALAVIAGLCAINIYTELELLTARTPGGFLDMKSPDYARIYYPHQRDTYFRKIGTLFTNYFHGSYHMDNKRVGQQ
jgi:hypothetical protein